MELHKTAESVQTCTNQSSPCLLRRSRPDRRKPCCISIMLNQEQVATQSRVCCRCGRGCASFIVSLFSDRQPTQTRMSLFFFFAMMRLLAQGLDDGSMTATSAATSTPPWFLELKRASRLSRFGHWRNGWAPFTSWMLWCTLAAVLRSNSCADLLYCVLNTWCMDFCISPTRWSWVVIDYKPVDF